METSSAHLGRRRSTHEALAARLAGMSDDEFAALLAPTDAWRVNGNGNQSGVIEVEGVKVFVKKIGLTDLERTLANQGSTANLFGLPLFYQYGIGSAGFGARRELQASLKAGAWALSGQSPYFPLVYHWRAGPRTPRPPLTAEQAERLERGVEYWEGSQAIRARWMALHDASAAIAVFLEYVPRTLQAWLQAGSGGGELDAEATIVRLGDQWRDAAAFMNERGMLHFDLHRHNVLTDGEQIYVADFGLALSSDFDLSPAERSFFETHRLYDRAYVDWAFTEWLVPETDAPTLTPALSALVEEKAPVSAILRRFFKALREETKRTPWPAAELEAALAGQAKSR